MTDIPDNREDTPKTPLEAERLAALVEQVIDGHPHEETIRAAIELGARPALVLPEPDEEQLIRVHIPAPDGDLHDAIGEFPVSMALPPQN
jgi:hypothetical protein